MYYLEVYIVNYSNLENKIVYLVYLIIAKCLGICIFENILLVNAGADLKGPGPRSNP